MPKMYPDDKTLEKFAHGKLSRRENLKVAWHLYNCAASREKIKEMLPEGSNLLEHLFAGLEPTDNANQGGFDTAFSRSRSTLETFGEARDRDRERAPKLYAELMRHPVSRQQKLIQRTWRFKNYVFAEYLLEKSYEHRTTDPARAEDLANLSLTVANQLENTHYGPALVNDLKARAWAYVANARRISDEMAAADEAFEEAEKHRLEGSQDPILRARIQCLLSLLRANQERFDEGLDLATSALSVYREIGDDHWVCRTLQVVATIHQDRGDLKKALAVNTEAIEMLNAEHEPRLRFVLLANQAQILLDSGRVDDALALIPDLEKHADRNNGQLDVARYRWLQARIAQETGDLDEAAATYAEVSQRFVEASVPIAAAQASLDLAVLYTQQGRTTEVKQLVEDLVPIFKSRQVHQQAYAALIVFQQAVRAETATVQMIKEFSTFLEHSRRNPQLKFEPKA